MSEAQAGTRTQVFDRARLSIPEATRESIAQRVWRVTVEGDADTTRMVDELSAEATTVERLRGPFRGPVIGLMLHYADHSAIYARAVKTFAGVGYQAVRPVCHPRDHERTDADQSAWCPACGQSRSGC